MARLPLHVMPTFCAVARLGNLRAAAEELHLTHSAISQQIKLLEEQIGFEVFDRRGRRVVLNAAGRALLRSAQPALALLDEGLQAAAAAAAGNAQRVRLTVLPSFAQRWLLPRMGRWHQAHPQIALELDASQQVVDVQREGFHAGLRQGSGHWPPLVAERLVDSPLIVVGGPAAARRLLGEGAPAIARSALLGNPGMWERWFQAAGLPRQRLNPVATFNDAGLMLQAAEQDLGLALVREVLAADALAEGRLVQLHPLAIEHDGSDSYYLVYPPALADWPPMQALLQWLRAELSRPVARADAVKAGTAPADR